LRRFVAQHCFVEQLGVAELERRTGAKLAAIAAALESQFEIFAV
jgi:hypothetical protein